MEGNQIDARLIARYAAGECSPEERAAVRVWKLESGDRKRFLHQIRRIWEASGQRPYRPTGDEQLDTDRDWERLHGRMMAGASTDGRSDGIADDTLGNGKPRVHPGSRASAARRQAMRVAAVIVLLVASTVLVVQYRESAPEDRSTEAATQRIITEPGQRATIRLADGSEVTLNVDSELRVPESFDQGARTIELDGEAYFDVVRDTAQPFTIRLGGAQVEVLGTTFGVQAYTDDRVRVVVEHGKVSILPTSMEASRAVELTDGQMGRLARQNSGIAVEAVDANNYLAWRDGRLIFQETPLPEVARTLERWYGIECRVEQDSLRDLQLTARLTSQSLTEVLDVISVSLDIEYEITSRQVVFTAPDARG